MVPFCKLMCHLSIVYGNGDGDGDSCMQGWMGIGTVLKLVAGIGMGMGIRVPVTVRDGYKYLSPCSCLRLMYLRLTYQRT